MRRLAPVVFTGVLLSACGGATAPEGVLVLRTVDGEDLPVSLRQGLCCRLHIISGSIQLDGDNTYNVTASSQREEFGILRPDTTVRSFSGTYSITGSTIVFIDNRFSEPGDTIQFRYTGTVQGDQITSANGPIGIFHTPPPELVFVYSG